MKLFYTVTTIFTRKSIPTPRLLINNGLIILLLTPYEFVTTTPIYSHGDKDKTKNILITGIIKFIKGLMWCLTGLFCSNKGGYYGWFKDLQL
jgi:hypothetical protein